MNTPTLRRPQLAFLAMIAIGSLAAGWWLREAWSGGTSSVQADIPVLKCEMLVAEFDAYPLLYLGDSFEGLPLNFCARRQSPGDDDGIPPTDRFVFVYGDCKVQPNQSSCPAPLQVTVYPLCMPSFPGSVARTEIVRGATADVFTSGEAFVETPVYKVKVSSGNSKSADLAVRAVAELRGANSLAADLAVDKPLSDATLVSAPAESKDPCKNELASAPTPPDPPPPAGPESTTADFSIDVDANTAGVQTTRTVALGYTFNLDVVATASLSWQAYQITLHYDDVVLDGVIPSPDQPWTAAPIEGVRGGNRFAFTTTPAFCTPSSQGLSRNLEDDAGLANWAMTCTEAATGTSHADAGALAQFTFTCEAVGSASLTLTDINDTFLLAANFAQYNDAQYGATITCQ